MFINFIPVTILIILDLANIGSYRLDTTNDLKQGKIWNSLFDKSKINKQKIGSYLESWTNDEKGQISSQNC